jgi:hypothetical protein
VPTKFRSAFRRLTTIALVTVTAATLAGSTTGAAFAADPAPVEPTHEEYCQTLLAVGGAVSGVLYSAFCNTDNNFGGSVTVQPAAPATPATPAATPATPAEANAEVDCAKTPELAGCDPDGHWCYDHPEDPDCAGVTGTWCDEHPDAAECNTDQVSDATNGADTAAADAADAGADVVIDDGTMTDAGE